MSYQIAFAQIMLNVHSMAFEVAFVPIFSTPFFWVFLLHEKNDHGKKEGDLNSADDRETSEESHPAPNETQLRKNWLPKMAEQLFSISYRSKIVKISVNSQFKILRSFRDTLLNKALLSHVGQLNIMCSFFKLASKFDLMPVYQAASNF